MQGCFEKYQTCETGISNQQNDLQLEQIKRQQKINGLGSIIMHKDPYYYYFMASGRLIDC